MIYSHLELGVGTVISTRSTSFVNPKASLAKFISLVLRTMIVVSTLWILGGALWYQRKNSASVGFLL
jgi:hypothetical protein